MRTAVVISLLAVLGCGGAVTGPEELVPGSAGAGTRFDEEPDATPSGKVLPPEICGNGLEDNGNGYIDEGCSCKVNATQACWPGDPNMRHVGPCRDGVQTCSAEDVEFPKWSACVGAVTDCDELQCQITAFSFLYNEVCCENAGGCCEGIVDHMSYGNCPGVVKTCHSR